MSINRKNFLTLSAAGLTALGLSGFNDPGSPDNPVKELLKPKRLVEGATLGLVAPGSPIYSRYEFDKMVSDLKNLGYTLKLGEHVRDRNGYLAGIDRDRADDLMAMFLDKDVDGILCIRGGWGCNRILPLLDYEQIRANPKPLIGFSDITSLHMAIHKKAGLVTFHGPVGKSDWNSFTVNSWNEVLIKAEKASYRIPDDQTDAYVIREGKATGRLFGGNLTVLTSMIGSQYLPDFSDSILFLEDIGEDVYRVDRMLTQLELAGILQQVNGFVFGKCTDCSAGENSLSLKQVLTERLSPYDIPAFYGAMISHEERNSTLPIGVQAVVHSSDMSLQLLEEGVE